MRAVRLARPILALALLTGQASPDVPPGSPSTTTRSDRNPAPLPGIPSAENTAFAVLQLESRIGTVTPECFRRLERLIDEAASAIGKLPRPAKNRWSRSYAEAALRCIDTTLVNHGFLYPDTGAVDLLSEALAPFQMTAEQRLALEAQPHNRRRLARIADGFPGPFHLLDCDTAALVYLGVADRANLPLRLVMIPSAERRPGHAFVRWRHGAHSLDWETADGIVRTDADYVREWRINPRAVRAGAALRELAREEVLGSVHFLLALRYERRRDLGNALNELTRARELFPRNPDILRQFAWLTATADDLPNRRIAAAITDAQFVVRLLEDADACDTLAAAYAAAGQFELAAREERRAILRSGESPSARSIYRERLRLYENRLPFRQSAARPPPGN